LRGLADSDILKETGMNRTYGVWGHERVLHIMHACIHMHALLCVVIGW
jgi:hypothetical protein